MVLVNTAGQIQGDYVGTPGTPAPAKTGPPGFVADLISRGLFLYLERSISSYASLFASVFAFVLPSALLGVGFRVYNSCYSCYSYC